MSGTGFTAGPPRRRAAEFECVTVNDCSVPAECVAHGFVALAEDARPVSMVLKPERRRDAHDQHQHGQRPSTASSRK
jgi:hypothetical protein